MKQSEAVAALRVLMTGLQKARSNAAEVLGFGVDEGVTAALADVMPRTFGANGGLLSYIVHVLNIYERTGALEPMAAYNLLALAEREPGIGAVLAIVHGAKLPPASDALACVMTGWAPETDVDRHV